MARRPSAGWPKRGFAPEARVSRLRSGPSSIDHLPLSDWAQLLALDRERVWHPYSPLPSALPPLPVVSAEGVRLRLADGRELIDGMSSWWCAIHGYRHPVLDAAVRDQLGRMAHVMFGGLTHEPAIRLARAARGVDPARASSTCSSRTPARSRWRWRSRWPCSTTTRAGTPSAGACLTVRGGYHGDTFGAMAVCDPVGGMHSLFTGTLPEHLFAPRPPDGFAAGLDGEWAAQVGELIERHAHELAAVIVEPVVQGAGGMRFHSPSCVALLRELCDAHGALLVLDEIATGFGRTGALFAAEHAGVSPDVMCVGKALTGGYMTLAATLCTSEVAHTISAGEGGALMHGPTFMASPLACAVALASLDLLEREGWRERVARIERGLREGLAAGARVAGRRRRARAGRHRRRADATARWMSARVTAAAVACGVWLRPFRDLIYTMPPYVIGEEDLAAVTGGCGGCVCV